MTRPIVSSSLSLAGPGRAGSVFARSWLAAGGALTEVIARDAAAAREGAGRLGGGDPRGLGESHAACDILVLAVPDDAIAAAASELAGRLRCRTVFHLSGALPALELEAFRRTDAALGSIHPLRVFTGSPGETWRGAFVAIEGESEAMRVADEMVLALEGRAHRIKPEAKPLYHAAATLAAGGTVALISLAARAWAQAGIPEEEGRPALASLAESAAAAAVARDFPEAFTGPVARRDRRTLAAHRKALLNRPELFELYSHLARETLSRTPGRPGEDDEIGSLFKVQS